MWYLCLFKYVKYFNTITYLKGKNNWSTDSAENTDSGAKPTVYKSQFCHLTKLYNLRQDGYIIYRQGS